MKTIPRNIITLMCLLVLGACSDYLDFKQEVEREASTLDTSEPDNIFKPVSAAYASLRDFGLHAFPYIGLFEITADNASKGSVATDNPPMKELDEFTYGANNELISVYWSAVFNAISAANNAIVQMPTFTKNLPSQPDIAKVAPIEAEARTLRAYYYFMLVRAFGGVPLITSALQSEQLNTVKRATKKEVYTFIEKELKWAVKQLPETYSKANAGRITKATAQAILAKAYLYQENWQAAKTYSDAIITAGNHGLVKDFYKLFRLDGENSEESIFEVQASYLGKTEGVLPTVDYSYVQGPRNNASALQGWGFSTPTDDLVKFFTDRNDIQRAAATLLYSGQVTQEGDSIYADSPNPIYNMKAYTPAVRNILPNNSYGLDNNIRLIRYADVLLMNAEAKQRLGEDASSPFNKVRKRVGLPEIQNPSLQQIWDERRAELAMEQDRFLDLVRTGQAKQVLGKLGYQDRNALFPIPAREIAINPNLTQNAGY